MVHLFGESGGDALALISHHDETMVFQALLVDVVAIEERTIDGLLGREGGNQSEQVAIFHLHSGDASHRRLHHLRIIYVGSVLTAIDMFDAKPVCDTDDRTEVAWVLHAIESEM